MQQETIFYSANSEQDAAKEARKQKRRKFVLAAEVLYLLLIALVFFVLIGRENAVRQMMRSIFRALSRRFRAFRCGKFCFRATAPISTQASWWSSTDMTKPRQSSIGS